MSDLLELNVCTASKGGKEEFLGMNMVIYVCIMLIGLYKFNLEDIFDRGEIDQWWTLQKRTSRSTVSGKIHLKMLYTLLEKQDLYIDCL